MQISLVVVGGVLTLLGAGLLVLAFSHWQRGRGEDERRLFRRGVLALAAGSALFLGAIVLDPMPDAG